MAQTNYTPISLYYSTTASAVPTAANLVPGELAINTNDGKLYYEDSSGVVRVLASKSTGSIGGSNTQVQFNSSGSLGGSSGLTWDGSFLTTSSIKNSALTSGRVTFAGASGLLSDSANLTWSGSSFQAVGTVYVGNGQSAATLGGTTATAGGLTDKDLTLSAWSPTSGSNEYGGDLYLSAGRPTGNGSGKLGSVYIKVGTGGVGSTGTGTLLNAYVAQDTAHYWYIGGTEKMRIDSSGNVGIGTTSMGRKLNIAAPTAAGIQFQSTGTGARNFSVFATDSNASVQSSFAIFDDTASAYRFTIDSSGIVAMPAYGAGAATFSASGVISSVSDETWKTKDGVPVNTDAMLQKLEPGYWFYNEEKAPTFGQERQLGFYAQNVHEAIGEEAAPTPQEGKPWGYHDRSVLAIAVMSLKNALNTIEELKQRITVLENK